MKSFSLFLGLLHLLTLTVLAKDYRFTLDGVDLKNPVLPVVSERKGEIAAGDIVRLHYPFDFVVGGPGHYQLRLEDPKEGARKLFCRVDDGPEHCIALHIGSKPIDDEIKRFDPLTELPAEKKKHLRCVSFDVAPADWKQALTGIDWKRCLLVLGDDLVGPTDGTPLEELPSSIRYLKIQAGDYRDEHTELGFLAGTKLRYADFGIGINLKAGALDGQDELVHLIADYATLENASVLAPLPAMKFLKLRQASGFDSISFTNDMPHLRVLKVDETSVSDISTLACPEIRLLSAMSTDIETLPDLATMPKLRDLRILSTPVSMDPEAVAAVRKALPNCVVRADWADTMRTELAEADRLRVRSGGTCHRQTDQEETLFEVTDPAAITSFFKSIEIDDSRSGFRCMCCGEPTIEAYRGEVLIGSLGFHHGHALRWAKGQWPGDAALHESSSRYICKLLAKHGHDGPLQEFEAGLARERAASRYEAALLEITTDAFYEDYWGIIGSDEASQKDDKTLKGEVQQHFSTTWPDQKTLARNAFAIYGAIPQSSWNLSLYFDDSLRKHILPSASDHMNDLLMSDEANGQVVQGIARWCLYDHADEELRTRLQPENLNTIIAWGLSHPRYGCRLQTLTVLEADQDLETLTDFFLNPPETRQLAEAHAMEPSGSVTYLPKQLDIPDGASVRSAAAMVLAKHGVSEIRETVSKLLPGSEGATKEAYEAAIKQLDQDTQ